MNDEIILLFIGSVFVTVFLLSQLLIMPTFGTNKAQRKKLKNRFDELLFNRDESHQQLAKEKYLDQLNPAARWVERLPPMANLKFALEQGGSATPAYKFLLWVLLFIVVATFLAWKSFHEFPVTLGTLAIATYLPFFWLQKKRSKNLDKFEEQLPEALEMMARSMRTGYPFNDCLKIVAEEMPDPVGREFGLLFDEINFGRNLEIALALMLERVPSLSLNAMATSVLIQKETGGNMSEILLKISAVLRGRFKLQRRVKTLAAEGGFSGWVLCLVPFFMFFALNLLDPTHFDALYEHPKGIMMFYVIGMLELVAILWMRAIVRIDV